MISVSSIAICSTTSPFSARLSLPINPEVTVWADVVRCICGAGSAIGIAIGWQEEDGQHYSSALVEPAEALSTALC